MKKTIEILSPGGDPDAVKAAIIGGADAVYLGLKKFNARKRAVNIDNNTLAELVNIAHRYNVKIFITLNILLTENEIPTALEMVSEIIPLGIDAVIIQDMGLANLLNRLFPKLEVHASTQMTTHNSYQIPVIQKLGIRQLNFSRELSHEELVPLINFSHDNGIKTEIFVHGAYCISCSGICYMSGVISANPGNRGACLQPCRRQYSTEENHDKEYLLSLRDNNALQHAETLIDAGADTLKIEGRIKNYNYVYEVTRSWREKIDNLSNVNNNKLEKNVQKVFNRDFSTGYYKGEISSNMFINSPLDQSLKHIGTVHNYIAKTHSLELDKKTHLEVGSRLNIYTNENQFICGCIVQQKEKGNTYQIKIENQLKGKILKGQSVLLLSDSNSQLKQKIDQLRPQRDILKCKVSGKELEQLEAEFSLGKKSIKVKSVSRLQKAEKSGLNEDKLIKQLGRLGDTQYTLNSVDINGLEDRLFIPIKELNNMRREAIAGFKIEIPRFVFEKTKSSKNKIDKKLSILVSDIEDYNLFNKSENILSFFEITSATRIKELAEIKNIWIPPFILDKELETITNLINEIKPNLIISDNSGIGNWLGEHNYNWIAGPQLNCTNGYSFDSLKENQKAVGAFYSTELNKDQIDSFHIPQNFTTFYIVFGPMILMTTRQCLFLKPNLCPHDKIQVDKGCLKGCDNYTKFSDEKDIPFHVLKSAGHYNRLFNEAQLFLPEAVQNINADYYLTDFRDLQFNRYTKSEKLEIVDFFEKIISCNRIDKEKEKSIKAIIGKVTKGNYQRGFE